MSRPGRVLVTDGHTNVALACVRSLGRAGYEVYVTSHYRWRPLAAWSRYSRSWFHLPDQNTGEYAGLRAWACGLGVQIVLPVTEAACLLCNAERSAWEAAGITVGCGPDAMLLQAFDKARTLEIAARCGLACPETRRPDSLDGYHAAANEVGFPCLVKPRSSNPRMGAIVLPDEGVGYVDAPSGLEAAVSPRRQEKYWPLLQRCIPGVGKGVFALCDHGRPVAWFAHERLRDVRPSGSGSSLRRSAPLDPELRAASETLLRAMQWHGPAMVEFRDDGVNPPWLMEVNGRFWGSLQLAIAAGVDFPLLWVRILQGEAVEPREDYALGVTMRWVWGDVKRLLHILRGPPPGYTGTFPSAWQGLRDLLGAQPSGTRNEIWNRADPWPSVGEWVQGTQQLIGLWRERNRVPASTDRRHATPDPASRETGDGARLHPTNDGPPSGEAPEVSMSPEPFATGSTPPPSPPTSPAIRVLMITSEWPTPGGGPRTTNFIKRQAEHLQASGVDVDVFHFKALRNPWNYLKAWREARRRIARNNYDLVHAQWGQSGLLALPKRLPLVVTLRGDDIGGIVGRDLKVTLAGRLLRRLTRGVTRAADAVILVSEHMKTLLHPTVPTNVIPSGLDFSQFRPMPREEARQRLGLARDKRLVLFVGRPATPRKRFPLARQAVDIVNRELPCELIVAWGVPYAEIPIYLNACDVLVFTSMQEGSPNAVKEALACNLPVVSVPVGDVAARLQGVAGCELCADDRPETIAAALLRVLRRGERAAGREAVKQLDERLTTQQVIGVYRSVLNPPRPAAAPARHPRRSPVRARSNSG
ncbi:MAG TPA: glycosyltransferase [Gemmatimonadales bacterium]|jgi:glycosyltransferase involved in cell wall biosynthesis/predicted ATP-grasp superfamily ATP-dependent carboligase|nr:glycosyltransferase [Gemmatimonadales bacterium]